MIRICVLCNRHFSSDTDYNNHGCEVEKVEVSKKDSSDEKVQELIDKVSILELRIKDLEDGQVAKEVATDIPYSEAKVKTKK